MDEAGALLGHHYFHRRDVMRGAGRGRGLGFPTANSRTCNELVPPSGVYATTITIDGIVLAVDHQHRHAADVRRRGRRDVETHVFDIERDLYDTHLRLSFVQRLRDERAFPDVDALRAQIEADCRSARRLFGRISL